MPASSRPLSLITLAAMLTSPAIAHQISDGLGTACELVIDKDRVVVTLDIGYGRLRARGELLEIDADGDRVISDAEDLAYRNKTWANVVSGRLRARRDGAELPVTLISSRGEGVTGEIDDAPFALYFLLEIACPVTDDESVELEIIQTVLQKESTRPGLFIIPYEGHASRARVEIVEPDPLLDFESYLIPGRRLVIEFKFSDAPAEAKHGNENGDEGGSREDWSGFAHLAVIIYLLGRRPAFRDGALLGITAAVSHVGVALSLHAAFQLNHSGTLFRLPMPIVLDGFLGIYSTLAAVLIVATGFQLVWRSRRSGRLKETPETPRRWELILMGLSAGLPPRATGVVALGEWQRGPPAGILASLSMSLAVGAIVLLLAMVGVLFARRIHRRTVVKETRQPGFMRYSPGLSSPLVLASGVAYLVTALSLWHRDILRTLQSLLGLGEIG